ncbi:3478_t:CDS:1 [Funneliformis geosporum]|nr:3478_t:CDS:1 [Funneliformis geosporum]
MISLLHFDPPMIPLWAYNTLILSTLTTFILFSAKKPSSYFHYAFLLIVMLSFVSIPVIYRSKYKTPDQNIALPVIIIAFKMIMWLKNCFKSNIKEDKHVDSFGRNLFYWRQNVTFEPKPSNIPTKEQINENLLSRVSIIMFKWILFELSFKYVDKFCYNVPNEIYFLRLFKWLFMSGNPPLSIIQFIHCMISCFLVYVYLSLNYDIVLLISSLILKYFSNKNLLTEKQIIIREWCTSLIFHTRHIFYYPYFSISPRDLWNFRWQGVFNESFKELGYSPVRSITNSHALGVLGAFIISGILHEYTLLVQMNIISGEHMLFFLFHGFMLLLWEPVIHLTKNSLVIYKKVFMWMIWMIIACASVPSFVEVYTRHDQYVILSVFTDSQKNTNVV